MKKNIDLIINGIAPEKVMYDTDNHSLVVLYPPQEGFKRGDILASDDALFIFDEYATYNKERGLFHSIWNNIGMSNKNWITKYFKHATDKQIAQLHEDLRKEGKKWNEEKLQVEDLDIKPKFKRGDIVFEDGRIIIVKNMPSNYYVLYYQLRNNISFNSHYGIPFSASTVRLATPEEQQVLFDALAKEGKKWNAETLQVEDLDISDIVVDGASACEYLNKSIPKNYIYDAETKFEKQINVQITLQLIREAWNKFDGFEADYANSEQDRYFPVLDVHGDIKYLVSWGTTHISASCLSFPTKARALQFGTQFKDLLKTAMGL